MAIVARFNASNFASGETSGFKNFTGATTGLVATQNAIDLYLDVVFNTSGNFYDGYPASSSVYTEFPRDTLTRQHLFNANEPVMRYEGLAANTQYTFTYLCASPTSDQRNVVISDGTNSVEYDDSDDVTVTVNPPVDLVSTSDASGVVTHTLTKGFFSSVGSHAFSAVIIDDSVGGSSVTGSSSHTAATATHDAAGVAGTLALSLDLVDSTGAAVADMTGITAVVYDAVGGAELHETATAATVGGTCVIEMPGGTADVGAEVFVTLHKAGASQQDDYNGCGRTTVTVS